MFLTGSRRINTRMAVFAASLLEQGWSVRIGSLPRHAWSFASLEPGVKVETNWATARVEDRGAGSRLGVVICFHWIMLPLAALLSAITGVALIYDEHDHYEINTMEGGGSLWRRNGLRKLVGLIHRLFLPRTTLVTCVHLKDAVLTKHLKRWQPATVELNNYPTRRWLCDSKSDSASNTPLCFIYSGGVFEEKGVAAAIQAFGELNRQHPAQAELHIFGKGDPSITDQAKGLSGIFVHGETTAAEIREFGRVRRCCGLAMLRASPRYDLVGTNLTKLYEYMAMSMPVIVSNVGEVGGFVKEQDLGLVVSPELNAGEIRDAMVQMLVNRPMFDRFAGRARQVMMRDDMTWEHEWKKVTDTGVFSGAIK